jgi:hypothetical protein
MVSDRLHASIWTSIASTCPRSGFRASKWTFAAFFLVQDRNFLLPESRWASVASFCPGPEFEDMLDAVCSFKGQDRVHV